MGQIYTHGWYTKDVKKIDKSVVELLTGDDSCHVRLCMGIEEGKINSEPLAINFAWRMPYFPPMIIDVSHKRGYELYSIDGKKVLLGFDSSTECFRDAVKAINNYIWKGTVEDLLDEFRNDGFEFIEKQNVSKNEREKYLDTYTESQEHIRKRRTSIVE